MPQQNDEHSEAEAERLRRANPGDYGEDETFPEDFRTLMRKVFAPLNWLRRR